MKKKLKTRVLTLIFIGIFLFSIQPKVYPLGGSAIGRNSFEPIWPKFDDALDDTDWEGLGLSVAMAVATAGVGMGVGEAATAAAAGYTGYAATAIKIGVGAAGMGVWGGISSEIQGGNFEDGFLVGAVTGGITQGVGNLDAFARAGIGALAGSGIGYLRDEKYWWIYGIQGGITGLTAGGDVGGETTTETPPDLYDDSGFSTFDSGGDGGNWTGGIDDPSLLGSYYSNDFSMPTEVGMDISPTPRPEWKSVLEKVAFKASFGFATTQTARTAGLAIQYDYQDKMRDTIIQARQEDWSDERLEGELDDLQDESILWTNIAQYTAAGFMTSFAAMVENAAFNKGYDPIEVKDAFANLGKGAFVGGLSGLGSGLAYTSVDYKKNPKLAQLCSETGGMAAGAVGQTLVEKGPTYIKDLFSKEVDGDTYVKLANPDYKVSEDRKTIWDKAGKKFEKTGEDDWGGVLYAAADGRGLRLNFNGEWEAKIPEDAIGSKGWKAAKDIASSDFMSADYDTDGNPVGPVVWRRDENNEVIYYTKTLNRNGDVTYTPYSSGSETYLFSKDAGEYQRQVVNFQDSKGITIATMPKQKFDKNYHLMAYPDSYSRTGNASAGWIALKGSLTFLDLAVDVGQRLATPANISNLIGSGIEYVAGKELLRNTDWDGAIVDLVSSSLGDLSSTIVNTSLLSGIASGIPLGYMNPIAKEAHIVKMNQAKADKEAQALISEKTKDFKLMDKTEQTECIKDLINSTNNEYKPAIKEAKTSQEEFALKTTCAKEIEFYEGLNLEEEFDPDDMKKLAYALAKKGIYNKNRKAAKEKFLKTVLESTENDWNKLTRAERWKYLPDIENKGEVALGMLWGDVRSSFITRTLPSVISTAMDFALKNNTSLDSSSRAYLTGGFITPAVFGLAAGYNPYFGEYYEADINEVDFKDLGPWEGAIVNIGGAQIGAVERMAGFGFPGTNPSISAFNNYAGGVTAILPKPYMPLFVVSSSKDKAKAEEAREWHNTQYVKNIYKDLGKTYIANTFAVSENIAKAFNVQRTFLVKIARPAVTIKKHLEFVDDKGKFQKMFSDLTAKLEILKAKEGLLQDEQEKKKNQEAISGIKSQLKLVNESEDGTREIGKLNPMELALMVEKGLAAEKLGKTRKDTMLIEGALSSIGIDLQDAEKVVRKNISEAAYEEVFNPSPDKIVSYEQLNELLNLANGNIPKSIVSSETNKEVINQLVEGLSSTQRKSFYQGDMVLSIGGVEVAETSKTGSFIMHTHPDPGISKITAEYPFNIQFPKPLTGIKPPYFYKHPSEQQGVTIPPQVIE